ncbi:hypothetical protein GCM10023193_59170 [Planotetraspora kaengkrachanensis]
MAARARWLFRSMDGMDGMDGSFVCARDLAQESTARIGGEMGKRRSWSAVCPHLAAA